MHSKHTHTSHLLRVVHTHGQVGEFDLLEDLYVSITHTHTAHLLTVVHTHGQVGECDLLWDLYNHLHARQLHVLPSRIFHHIDSQRNTKIALHVFSAHKVHQV